MHLSDWQRSAHCVDEGVGNQAGPQIVGEMMSWYNFYGNQFSNSYSNFQKKVCQVPSPPFGQISLWISCMYLMRRKGYTEFKTQNILREVLCPLYNVDDDHIGIWKLTWQLKESLHVYQSVSLRKQMAHFFKRVAEKNFIHEGVGRVKGNRKE